uniref:Ectonucleoside triphosphate diphosphohydrolase 8 n=1 Tax=Otus sunia TaxID=257818 RepID=A0A8C8BNM5_9STRI
MDYKAKTVAGLLAATCVFSIIALILSVVNVKDVFLPPITKYGLVFDAGSTHTALYIYRWPADKENGTGIVSQVEACTAPGSGISSYANNPAEAGAILKPCLDKAMKIIPAEQQRDTPTYLGATAGMRLLCQTCLNLPAIGEYPVDFRGAQILTGNEEGSFGWITINYLLETLVKVRARGEGGEGLPSLLYVVGALDLGGASTQITFLPGTTIDDSSTRSLLRLYGANYSIYTHSYLCYGQNQALKMLMGSPSPQQISHPCYPVGYQENITTSDLYNSPCVRAPSTPSPAQVLTVIGTGDPAACSTAIQKLFNFTCGTNRTCGFNGVYQLPVRGQFFAVLGLCSQLQCGALPHSVGVQSTALCWQYPPALPPLQMQEEFPTMNRTHLRDVCAASSYILTLLLQGYKFNHTTWLDIHFVQQVANVDVGWTLGYMLNLTNMIPSETPQRVVGLQRSNWVAATVLLAVMIILIFCLLTVICCQKNSSGYESL